jgi:hypothetical protein
MDPAKLGRAFEELPEAAPSRGRLLGGFALGVAGALAAGTLLESLRRRRAARREDDAAVDRAGEDSFPASDAPAFAEPDRFPEER